MDIQDVRQKILQTLRLISEQEKPNVRLIEECIDLMYENGLEKDLSKELSQLKILKSMGSFLQESDETFTKLQTEDTLSNKELDELFDNLDIKESKKLVFTVKETEEGNLATSLDTSGLQTLELLGCISLMEKAVNKVIKRSQKD